MNSDKHQQLLDAINQEIEEAQREEERSGWTMWALVAGIASLIWLATDVLKDHVVWAVAIKLFIGSAFLFQSVTSFWMVVGASPAPSSIRYSPSFSVIASRRLLLVAVSEDALILFLMMTAGASFTSIPNLVAWLLIIFKMITVVVGVSSSVFGIPIPMKPKGPYRWGFNGTGIIMAVGFMVAAWPYSLWAIRLNHIPIPEVRLALLGFGLYVIAPRLADIAEENPLVRDLRELRRAIVLADLPYDEARRRADTVILGLRATEVVQGTISRIVAQHARHRSLLDSTQSQIAKIQDLLDASENAEAVSDVGQVLAAVGELQKAVRLGRDVLASELLKTQKFSTRLVLQTRVLTSLSPESKPEIDMALHDVLEAVQRFGEEIQQMLSALKVAEERANGLHGTQLALGKEFTKGGAT